tara:strand:- start:954 stop:2819 length:1866 start_codon:yes stop_codon:yes gene_type:complete
MFKPKSDAVQIGQDSYKIPCRNGVAFGENAIVRFDIPRNAGFCDLANSYVSMEIELTNDNNTAADQARQPMLQLDRITGASSLISQMTIRSEGRVIEELRNYNTYAHLHYNATLTEGAMNRRSKLEGCANSYMPQDNPYFTDNQVLTPSAASNAGGLTNANGCYKPVRRKVLVPLLGGMFSNPRSHPSMVMPLEVELILEPALRALRVASKGDNQIFNRCIDMPNDNAGAPASFARRHIVLRERSEFNTLGGATAAATVPSNGVEPIEGENQLNKVNNCWWRVGQQIFVKGDGEMTNAPTYAAGGVITTITAVRLGSDTNGVATNRNCIILEVGDDLIGGAAADGTNVEVHQLNPLTGDLLSNQGSALYTVHNPQLVVQKVIPPPAVVQQISSAIARGEYNVDIISYTNVDNAIPATQTTSTNIISSELSRVKSILSVPTSQSNTDDLRNSNVIQGQYLNATNYQYQIDNKLQPDRRVDLVREQFPVVVSTPFDNTLKPYRWGSHTGGFHRYETEKALKSANINLKNLTFITKNPYNTSVVAGGGTGTDVGGITNNAINAADWLVGRALGAGAGTSENLVGKSVILYLNYNANSNMVKLLKNFLIHVRTISVSMEGISVYY